MNFEIILKYNKYIKLDSSTCYTSITVIIGISYTVDPYLFISYRIKSI